MKNEQEKIDELAKHLKDIHAIPTDYLGVYFPYKFEGIAEHLIKIGYCLPESEKVNVTTGIVWPEKKEPSFNTNESIPVGTHKIASVFNSGWNACHEAFMAVINNAKPFKPVDVSVEDIHECLMSSWSIENGRDKYERFMVCATAIHALIGGKK